MLSRIDAGTLQLQRDETDVFTLLVLAADNLQELSAGSRTSVDIPEQGEMLVTVDLDWTMEAVMNLSTIPEEQSTVPMRRIRSIRKSGSGTMGKDLQKRTFRTSLNGFTGGKTHVRAVSESGWLCQRR